MELPQNTDPSLNHAPVPRARSVLHILNELMHSGAESTLVQMAPGFLEARYRLHVLAVGRTEGDFAGAFRNAGFSVHHITFGKSLAFFRQVWKLCREGRFDVVHIHTERAYLWYALIARLAGTRRVVRTIHSIFAFSGLLRLQRTLSRQFCRHLLGVTFVGVSRSVQENERRRFHVKVETIPNGIDTVRFSPPESHEARSALRKKWAIPDEAVVLISVGSCQPVKNHATILRAVKEVEDAGLPMLYLHVGSGPQSDEEKSLARELGLDATVRFLGTRRETEELYRCSDIFLMPSLYEGQGIAAMEAMSTGVPPLVLDSPGLRELVHGNVDGLVAAGSHAFISDLKLLMRSPELREKLGAAARRTALAEFPIARTFQALLRTYGSQN